MRLHYPALVLAILHLGTGTGADAQEAPPAPTHVAHTPTAARATGATDSVPLYEGLGSYSRPVSTRSPLAQRYFDQGMRLTYSFGKAEAARSFEAAVRADSTCAMCWWGIAWAVGPYINGPRLDSLAGVKAYVSMQQANRHAVHASPVERALIEAMSARYAAVATRANRAPLDSAYANAMRDVVRRFPNDLDAAALLGEALMVLRPWDQWTRVGDPQPGTEEVVRVLESVLRRNNRHPGACHHYIHATEASRNPGRAAACADLLGDIIPGASHIPHMPSHTYMRVGRYADAVRANQQARLADQRAAFGGAPGTYVAHNAQMLASAAVMDGQSAVAIQAADDLTRLSPGARYYQGAVLARFGRWRELLAIPPALAPAAQLGMTAFGRGLAHLALGRADSARAYLAVLTLVRGGTPDSLEYLGHPVRSLLGIAEAILGGEISAAAGKHDDAIARLRTALVLEDSLNYDEPEPWPIPVRHVLGAVLLEAGRASDAEAVYREDLQRHPDNGWALAGLERALRAGGRTAEADEVARQLARVWMRADVILNGSRVRPVAGR